METSFTAASRSIAGRSGLNAFVNRFFARDEGWPGMTQDGLAAAEIVDAVSAAEQEQDEEADEPESRREGSQ